MGVFVIAEAGSSWDCDESKAFRLIEAAKACGADAVKFQWTSNAKAMAERRLGPNAVGSIEMYKRYLEYPLDVLKRLKAHCDSVSIEFMVTVYLIEDIATIAPLVKRFKVSAYESRMSMDGMEFVNRHLNTYQRETIVSTNAAGPGHMKGEKLLKWLHCVSMYPTPLHEERLGLVKFVDGLSDHTANVLTGAAAVAAGARIVEAHMRLFETSEGNPDYKHSLVADVLPEFSNILQALSHGFSPPFAQYVQNIRTVERML